MAFSQNQIRQLKRSPRKHHVRSREVDGIELRYLEGRHVISEANKIFGYDGWSRETIESRCVYSKHVGARYEAVYVARVRISVPVGGGVIIREGTGSGEASTSSPGRAHELALKASETDATKRALTTFGNAFGLGLYRGKGTKLFRGTDKNDACVIADSVKEIEPPQERSTPESQTKAKQTVLQTKIDKSVLTLSEPRRVRDPQHLKNVALQPCVICGRFRAQAHHVKFAQPGAMARKVSDEFAVPLCMSHHHELHQSGSEIDWWQEKQVDPLPIAKRLWENSNSQITKM